MNQNLDLIRQKCIEANPEIDERRQVPCPEGMIGCATFHYEIKTRPIRLADVLLAMNKLEHDGSYIISAAGIFAHFKAEGARIDKALRILECSWNLRKDDLNEQPKETINFLAGLLR